MANIVGQILGVSTVCFVYSQIFCISPKMTSVTFLLIANSYLRFAYKQTFYKAMLLPLHEILPFLCPATNALQIDNTQDPRYQSRHQTHWGAEIALNHVSPAATEVGEGAGRGLSRSILVALLLVAHQQAAPDWCVQNHRQGEIKRHRQKFNRVLRYAIQGCDALQCHVSPVRTCRVENLQIPGCWKNKKRRPRGRE